MRSIVAKITSISQDMSAVFFAVPPGMFFKSVLLAVAIVSIAMPVQAADSNSPCDWAKTHVEELVKIYYELHQSPELSFHEEKTAERLADELRKLGCEVTTRVGGFGVVGVLKNGPGKVLLLRTDMDALPVIEQTQLPYASKVKVHDDHGNEVGTMHACGHDIHMTSLIGVMRYLASHQKQWQGTVVFVGQPAEERGAGAKAMLDDGLYERFPKPDFAVALHCDSALETGKVGFRSGPTLANVDSVDVIMKGRGGHGAYPHTTVDPIVQAAQLVLDLQTVVSREIAPIDPAVITVGSIHGGTKHNVIGDECHLQLTVRSYTPEVRTHLLEAIKRKANAVAASYRAPEPVIELTEGTPALVNDSPLVERISQCVKRALGDAAVVDSEQSMGGEDFGRLGHGGVPVCMFRLGTIAPQRMARFAQLKVEVPSLHSALYYPDPVESLETGVAAMSAAALDLLAPAQP
jgi:hippurate hydrolase